MKTQVISATELRTRCTALLDEVEAQGNPITVTRQGKPIAVLSPAKKEKSKKKPKKWKSPADSWAGRMEIVGDIVNSDPEIWDVARK